MTEIQNHSTLRIQDIPFEERPRERLARLGPSALSNEELLALLLGTGARGESALDRSRRILSRHGGLAGLAALSGAELRRERGIKEARGAAIEAALFLNARNRLLRHDPEIYRGTLDRAVVEPRELLKRALLANAAGLIVYHNHPSGDPTPSREDREFTRRLAAAAESVGLRLLDHIVVARDGCVSFREAGLM